MNSRERVAIALSHQEPDRVPLDVGGWAGTSMHVSTLYRLRQKLQLDPPGTPVKLVDPYQMLGEIGFDLLDLLDADVVPLTSQRTIFGFKNEGWKPWTYWDGTPVLVPAGFNTDPEPNGDLLQYPEGDKSVPPSGRMPRGGFYTDSIIRQPPLEEEKLDPHHNLEDFGPISDEELEHFRSEAERLWTSTDRAIQAHFGGTSFGDIALVPAPWLKHPKGIRDVAEWYMSTVLRRGYVYEVFEHQCEIALANLEKIHQAVGDRVMIVFITGADFGAQLGPLISPTTYGELFFPFHKRVNDWIHAHTSWKTYMHCCGSVASFMNDFIAAGFDIFNPVQCSAADMAPIDLKECFGSQITFWGGAVDNQHTLPFGTPEEVRRQTGERVAALAPGGGFVFATEQNVQALVPVENLLAMFDAWKECRRYS